MTATDFLSRLQGVRKNGMGWQARCPAHDDRNPSLSVSERDGKILLCCHAGCEPSSIVQALGLTVADLFADSKGDAGKRIAATYDYADESGKLLYQVVRFEPKDFKQRRPDGKGGWAWNLDGVRRVPYRLPEFIRVKSVLIVEGERDVETGRKLGLTATCNPHGAGKWKPEYSESLREKRVAILCDADSPGVAHGRAVARSLIGVAESVRLIEALPQAKDLTDWVEKGGTREALLSIIKANPGLTAADVATWQPSPTAGGFTLTPLGELLAQADRPVEYIWDSLLVAGTVSGVFAKPKVGKGTLARNLVLAVSRGDDFLGFATEKGECIYLGLEERGDDIKRDFRAMGANGSEPILVHAAAAPADGIRALCDLVKARKPRLVIIDPIIRLARIKDEKAYAETYAALGPLIDAARESGTHVMLLHHSGKSLKADAVDSPLGSTAIAGAVSTLLVLKRGEAYRTVQTVQRIGQDMPETVLQFDSETKRLSLGGTRLEADRSECEKAIHEFLRAAEEPQTQAQIREAVEGKTAVIRAALTSLVKSEKVKKCGDGTRGKPFLYEFWFSGSQHIPGTREPGNQKRKKRLRPAWILALFWFPLWRQGRFWFPQFRNPKNHRPRLWKTRRKLSRRMRPKTRSANPSWTRWRCNVVAEILETLAELGIKVTPNGDRLRLEPASKVPPDLVPRIREAKPEILAALRERPAHVDPPPERPCYACGSRLFWRSIYGAVICYRCHEPGSERLIADILYDGEVKWKQ